MALPPDWRADFAREALYDPSAWCVHDVLDVDPETRVVRAVMETTDLPLVAEQRVVPGHPAHVPAAMVIQASGTMGHLWAVYGMGLRPTEGWVGFGTHIKKARWGRMGEIGPPLQLEGTCIRVRTLWSTTFCTFAFRFTQDGEVVYRSEQIAAWKRGEPD